MKTHTRFGLAGMCIATGLALAMTLAVLATISPSHAAPAGIIRVPDDYATIQQAIDAANDGDTILVAQGTYAENLSIGKAITLSGGWDTSFINRTPGKSSIDGNRQGRVISVTSATSTTVVTIDGFTIANGDASGKGGLTMVSSGIPEFGPAEAGADALVASAAVDPALLSVQLRETASRLVSQGALGADEAAAILSRATSLDTLAGQVNARPQAASAPDHTQANGTDCGGGLYSWNTSLHLLNNVIVANTASQTDDGYGGGACVGQAPYGGVYVAGNHFGDNVAGVSGIGFGGGLFLTLAPGAIISDNQFDRNVATHLGDVGVGGGLGVDQADHLAVQSNAFVNNVASANAQALQSSFGGGAYLRAANYLQWEGNMVQGNTAGLFTSGIGGGLYLFRLNHAEINVNQFLDNWGVLYHYSLGYGGGVGMGELQYITVTGNLLAQNYGSLLSTRPDRTFAGGGGLFAATVQDAWVAGNTITGNVGSQTSKANGGGLYLAPSKPGPSERIHLDANHIAGNSATLGSHRGRGGGVHLVALDSTVMENIFEGNQTCVACSTALGGGLAVSNDIESIGISSGPVLIDRNRFVGNRANGVQGGNAGALDIRGTDGFTITNNVFAGNQAASAEDVFLSMGFPVSPEAVGSFVNNTLVGGNAAGLTIEGWNATSALVVNNAIVSYTVGVTVSEQATATLRYNLFNQNDLDVGGAGEIAQSNAITAPVYFINPATDDYRLRVNSAARDAGDPAGSPPAPDHDADGNPRPFGPRVDMGAYEWRGYQTFLPIVRTSCREYCVGWGIGSAADGYGVILRTDDSGVTWTRQGQAGAIPDVNLNGVSAVDAQNAWAVGGRAILHTRDGGLTWEQQALPAGLPADFELFQVKALDTRTAFAVGGSGVLLQTTDGTTWTKMSTSPDLPLIQYSDVDAADATHVWAVGGVISGTNPRGGLAIAFYDGVQWQWQGSNIVITQTKGSSFIGLSVVDQDTAWAVGGPGYPPFKTVDGGVTWRAAGDLLDVNDTNRVVAVTHDLVWATADGGIFRTTNGGGDWVKTTAACGGFWYCYAISAAGTQYAWASDIGSLPGNLHRWVNGNHWEAQMVPANSTITIMSFVGARR